MNRILFFVHYNKYGGLSNHVAYLLERIKWLYSRVVFISNSPLSEKQKDKLAGLCHDIILRENKGFDFGAWKDALLEEGWEALSRCDSVTLMNDTCFGPLFDMGEVYDIMERRDCDFWGLTSYRASVNGMPGTNGPIPEHIQSYFLCFNKPALASRAFHEFWSGVEYEIEVEKVIQKYETRLTRILADGNLRWSVFIDIELLRNPQFYPNASLYHPDMMIRNHIPLLKIRSFSCFSMPSYLIKAVEDNTDYPARFIYDYCNDIYDPNTSIFIENKTVQASSPKTETPSALNAAIHLHVYYLDVFEKYMGLFEQNGIHCDLYFTTDSLYKKEYIERVAENYNSGKNIKEIIIVENRGRDVIPWLSIADKLASYDVVGHFHTKKSPQTGEWQGSDWQEHIFDSLVRQYKNIVEVFAANKKIGVVIPDAPYFFRVVVPLSFMREVEMQKAINELWKRMQCKKEMDFSSLPTAIFPVGDMFWYRPAALKPLFDLRLSADDVPPEPLPVDRTILHCLERMIVYIAWNEGYDYRIMAPERPMSYFVDNMTMNREVQALEKKYAGQYQLFVAVRTPSRLKYADNVNYACDEVSQANDIITVKGWLFYQGYEKNNECKRFVVLAGKESAYIFNVPNILREDLNEVFKREYDVRFSGVNARLYTGDIASNSGGGGVFRSAWNKETLGG